MVGWGDAAITEALYLSELAKEVHILVRGNALRAENVWVEKAKRTHNIILHFETSVKEIRGKFNVESLLLNSDQELRVDGVFIAIGSDPDSSTIDHFWVKKDETGCVIVDARQSTSIPGIYAAGDITTNSAKFKQTIMSAAEWCLAAHSIHEDLLRWIELFPFSKK